MSIKELGPKDWNQKVLMKQYLLNIDYVEFDSCTNKNICIGDDLLRLNFNNDHNENNDDKINGDNFI